MEPEYAVIYQATDRTHEEEYMAHTVDEAARFISSMEGMLLYADVFNADGELIEIT